MPFGLTAAESPMISEILDNDDSLMSSVKGLMAQAKSDGTMENYERMTTKFATFCGEKGYSYPRFTEKAALHFVIQLDKDKSSWSVLCQVKPALALVEKLAGGTVSVLTSTVDIYLSAAKRRAAEVKPVVQKAGILPDDILVRLYPVCVTPHAEGNQSADPVMLRTYVRAMVAYFTFCRFNCYSKLRACDLEDDGTCIQITFRSAKNDQFHKGQTTWGRDPLSPAGRHQGGEG
jgi:hypothetical protein